MSSAEKSIIPEFLDKIEIMGLQKDFAISAKEIVYLPTGSSIMFSGIRTSSGNQTAALKSLTNLTGLVLDEAEELLDEELFNKIDLSVRSTKNVNYVVLIMNPSTKDHWIYKRFFERPMIEPGSNLIKHDVTYIHTTWEDNRENLPDDYIESMIRAKITDPKRYDHEIMGGWKEKAEGAILTDWDVAPFKMLENRCYGQDFGFSDDPTVLVEVSLDPESRQMWVRELFRKKRLTTRQIAELDIAHAGSGLVVSDIEPRLVHELKALGVNIKAVNMKDKHLASSIALMQDMYIHVDPGSKELLKEFNTWAFARGRDYPAPGNDHGPDAIRYTLPRLYTRRKSGLYVLK